MNHDDLQALIYHRVPTQVCYVLGRASIKSLDKVRAQTREQLVAVNHIGPRSDTYIERALAAIDAAEASSPDAARSRG